MKNKQTNQQFLSETDNDVVKTLIITLWARAKEQSKNPPILYDPHSKELYDKLNYDDSKLKRAKMSQVGCCIRAKWMDEMIQNFANRYPEGIVVQVGCGLDPRFERLSPLPSGITWYNLDLPEVIDVRKKLMPASSEDNYFATSLFDEAWMKEVSASKRPTLLVIEGVLMYFKGEEVKSFFHSLLKHFTTQPLEVVMDCCPPIAVNKGAYHDSVQKVGAGKANFSWGPEDCQRELEAWDSRIDASHVAYMSDYDTQKRFPLFMRLFYKTKWGYRRLNQRMVWVRIAPNQKE